MATWTAPTTRASGALITATIWNTDLVENLKYLKDAPVIDTAVILGAATTSGIRLDLESGVLAVREGDDSAYGPLISGLLTTSGNHVPAANDGGSLGISGTAWSDLFLASGGVINFNAGDVTITHSSNVLAFAGASTYYEFDSTLAVGHGNGAGYSARIASSVSGTSLFAYYDAFAGPAYDGNIIFRNNTNNGALTERMRITSGGLVGIGGTPGYLLDVRGGVTSDISIRAVTDSASNVESLRFFCQNTTEGARISAIRTAASNAPNDLAFYTSVSGVVTERARITSGGALCIGKTSDDSTVAGSTLRATGANVFVASSAAPLAINRLTTDGSLVDFYQDTTLEGSISVSGTTVSYNGGHLARWSQTATNTRIALLKGTVLSNLDQMAVWIDPETGQPHANEQLNCMKVSDVEGDPNVAGVFVNWDDSDDVFTSDMNVAMTGDMIIRVGAGVTVQRGDLLMSAGDGTATPQGDDIRRSKTIAKVTSTHVSCTYPDGSYCVPCVLMAC